MLDSARIPAGRAITRQTDVRCVIPETSAVSGLLRAWGNGDLESREKLMPLVYAELRRRAAAYLDRERKDHTLQPTALVHEAYLRLIGQQRIVWQNRAHFFAIAAQTMRRILVDHARGRGRDRRFGGAIRVTLDERLVTTKPAECDMLLLNQALDELAGLDARQAHIVELRYFGGLSEREIASVLDVSRSTVTREWVIAKGWLFRRISGQKDAR